MTREEAVKRLKEYAQYSYGIWHNDEEDTKAFDMAIEALQDRPDGEWILVKGSNGKDYHKCSKCLHTQEITGVKNYCAVCGTRMKGGDDE